MCNVLRFTLLIIGFISAISCQATLAPSKVIADLKAGKSVNLIVEYEDSAIQQTAVNLRKKMRGQIEDDAVLKYKRDEYKVLKSRVDNAAAHVDVKEIKNYSHLPLSFKRFNSLAGLNYFLAQPSVKAVYEDVKVHPVLTQSLPLISQPTVASAGEQGQGTTVAVIDTGIDYTHAAFGACTAPNVPSNCRVVVAQDFLTPAFTDHSHGTNVSGIVLGVAPQANIAMLNVFDSAGGANSSTIISAINWAITNKSTYNIVAINMSLGDDSNNSTICSNNWASSAVANAKNAGISVIVAAGNSSFTQGLASPACTPSAISVGAVYDANMGGVTWNTTPNCTDNNPSVDQVTCFSNSASYLSLLAPGALISAAGISQAGTSQAAPHVAGAIAVLRSTFPQETLATTLSRLTSTGTLVTDSRNGISKPRLNLLAAARPTHDAFAKAISLSGSAGSTTGISLLSTKEVGEPNHASNAGGHSVWWKWVAPAAGQLSLNTLNTNFDTLLGVYTGTTLNALTAVAANNNEGSTMTSGLLLQTVANKTYFIAVDGADGSAGAVVLNWSLNPSAKANLVISLTGPSAISLGTSTLYTMAINNAGPQSATNIVAQAALPDGASYVSGSSACSANGHLVTCTLNNLAANSAATFNFQLLWTSLASNAAISASVQSDLPDSSTSDNSGQLALVLNNATSNGDVPLPPWALLLMATSMLVISLRVQNS